MMLIIRPLVDLTFDVDSLWRSREDETGLEAKQAQNPSLRPLEGEFVRVDPRSDHISLTIIKSSREQRHSFISGQS